MGSGSWRERLRKIVGRLGASAPADGASRASPGGEERAAQPLTPSRAFEAVPGLRSPEADLELAGDVRDALRSVSADRWARWLPDMPRPQLAKHFVPRFASFPDDIATELLGVASRASDGHVREAALRALGRLHRAEALRYVLPRLGDWVPQVRVAARETLDVLMTRPMAASELFAHFRLVQALRRIERVDLSDVHAQITGFVRGLQGGATIRQAFESRDAELQIFAYELFEDEICSDPQRIDEVLALRHPALRHWLLTRILKGRVELSDAQLRRALTARDPRFVATLIRRLDPSKVADFEEDLFRATMANSAAIRDAARQRLRSDVDLAQIAARTRATLDDTPFETVRPGLIAALCELDGATSYERTLVFLDHGASRVRESTVRGLTLLDRSRAARDTLSFLSDASGRVRRAVQDALTLEDARQWLPRVRQLLQDGDEDTQLAALRALRSLSLWDALPELLLALASDSPRVRERTCTSLSSWWNEYRRKPWLKASPSKLADVARVWPRARDLSFIPQGFRPVWRSLGRLIDEQIHGTHDASAETSTEHGR